MQFSAENENGRFRMSKAHHSLAKLAHTREAFQRLQTQSLQQIPYQNILA